MQTAALVVPSAAPIAPVVQQVAARPAADPVGDVVAELKIAAADRPAQTVVERGKAQAMAMLDRKLLSDSTLGDLLSGARRETVSYR